MKEKPERQRFMRDPLPHESAKRILAAVEGFSSRGWVIIDRGPDDGFTIYSCNLVTSEITVAERRK